MRDTRRKELTLDNRFSMQLALVSDDLGVFVSFELGAFVRLSVFSILEWFRRVWHSYRTFEADNPGLTEGHRAPPVRPLVKDQGRGAGTLIPWCVIR